MSAVTLDNRLQQLTPLGQRLVWVIAGLALAVAPHVGHIALWTVLIAALAAAFRMTAEIKRWPLPSRSVCTGIAFASLLGVLAGYRTLNGIDAGTSLLIVMAGMKLLETRTVRDLTVVVFLSYFALFAAFLYNQNMLLLPYMLLTAGLLTMTLMRIHQTEAAPIREAAATTAKMFLQALPLAVLLFLFFPRLPGQFWAVPARERAITGLSEEMTPGDVSELSVSGTVAFRVKFEGEAPPPRERYWRGPVMHMFDGRTWRSGGGVQLPEQVASSGSTYRYRISLEPQQRNWIFALDMATGWDPKRAYRTEDFQLHARQRQLSVLTSFDLESSPTYVTTGELRSNLRRLDTYVPRNRNKRTLELARQMRERAGSDEAFIQSVLTKFGSEEYYYTLQPPALSLNAVDDFLFNSRRGFCEHFASAFTVMARSVGIPARVVTGYQGGEYNPISGYLVVRQSDAHAWSEVWLEGRGWQRIDPTAAIAPERIERGLDAAISSEEEVPGRLLRQSAVLSKLRMAWDAANTFWNDQVVEFGEAQQHWLLDLFNIKNPRWEYLGVGLVVTLIGFFAILSAYLTWRFKPRSRDPVAHVYEQLCRKLAKLGVPRLPHEGPNDYVTRAAQARPELAAQLAEVRSVYVSLRYGPMPLQTQLSRLKFLVNQLEA
jgi:transglutaminase-like putative cysteine protease